MLDPIVPSSLEEQKQKYEEDGYVVFPGFWNEEICHTLRSRMEALVQGFDLKAHRSVFSTNEQNRTSDEYFLDSGDKIRFFWEENAFDQNGESKHDRCLSINKVGHALHDLDPTFQKVTYNKELGRIAREVAGLEKPIAVQSMYIFKQKKIGGEVGAHQDGTFLYTEPQSVVGFWWALEECSTHNGCLWVIPGSHKQGVKRRFKRKNGLVTGGTEFEQPEAVAYDTEEAVALEVPCGSLVVLHNALVHYSLENRSEKSRHAYTLHVVEGGKGTVYPRDNWLQRPPEMPFNPLPS